MISREALTEQLQRLHFNPNGWGRTEAKELCNILMPDEEIEELVNGYYDAGFALLVATKNRVLLVDKKPLNYLTVEDMRFDMINEFDYSHRILGAHISITSGNRNLCFTSFNQTRLRSLLTFVQGHMTELKRLKQSNQETQQLHLEQMNEQLRQYLSVVQQQSANLSKVSQPYQPIPATEQTVQQSAHVVPAPTGVTPQWLTDREGFERLAAQSVGLNPTGAAQVQSGSPTIRKIALTPQQVGLAAARRVLPVVAAYAKSAEADNQYAAAA